MTFQQTYLWTICSCLAIGSVACGADDSEVTGNLGQADFSYRCIDGSDPACSAATASSSTPATPNLAPAVFPKAFAVGSRFTIKFQLPTNDDVFTTDQPNYGNPIIKPVSAEFLKPDVTVANAFVAEKAGFAGIYAVSTVDSEFIDYTLLRIAPVDKLAIGNVAQLPLSVLNVSVGETQTLVALPMSEGVTLAGAQDFAWTIGDSSIASLSAVNPTASATVTTLKAGTTPVHLTLGALTTSINLTVTP